MVNETEKQLDSGGVELLQEEPVKKIDLTPTSTLDLTDVGLDGQWVRWKRLVALPYEEFKIRSIKAIGNKKVNSSNITYKDFITDSEGEIHLSMELIEEWNVLDRDGNSIPLPSEEPGSWVRVPVEVLAYIMQTMKKDTSVQSFLST